MQYLSHPMYHQWWVNPRQRRGEREREEERKRGRREGEKAKYLWVGSNGKNLSVAPQVPSCNFHVPADWSNPQWVNKHHFTYQLPKNQLDVLKDVIRNQDFSSQRINPFVPTMDWSAPLWAIYWRRGIQHFQNSSSNFHLTKCLSAHTSSEEGLSNIFLPIKKIIIKTK